jgi:UDP-GlcNAc:undecaprenyl-phosphate/decaprenyl-phosphate GlcNAc-1-phosphate transferase
MLVNGNPAPIFALYAFALALAIAWVLTPLTEPLAHQLGAIDYPDERSLHTAPTPRLGGLAIFTAAVVCSLLFLPLAPVTRALVIGAAAITLLGVLDDIFELNAGLKLAGQIVAVSIPVFTGVTVGSFTLPFLGGIAPNHVHLFTLPVVGELKLDQVLTILGIVAVINIINFSDGVDGLAAGVCAISGVTMAIIALSLERTGAGVLAAIAAGGALGFLRRGFPPAKTFMGDTGSGLLGYLLGAIAIEGALKTNAVVALFFPLIVLAVPILDTGFVVAKRIKYRQPIHKADRWHFHHRMTNIGFSQRRTLAYLYGWVLILAALALALRFVPYSDNHGHFNVGWTIVIILFALAAVAASVYLVVVLEILKLRSERTRGVFRMARALPPEAVDEGVARELETGTFAVVDPSSGELEVLDTETGEFEVVQDGQ